MATRRTKSVTIYVLPWWYMILGMLAAGGFGVMVGISIVHYFDIFGDRARLELYREELLDGAPYTPWIRDYGREERQDVIRREGRYGQRYE